MSNNREPSPFKQEIQRDIKTFRSLKGRKRLSFIWDYYKLPIIIALILIYVTFVFGRLLWEGHKPCRLRACVVLNTDADCSEWFDSFTKELKKDGKSGAVDINLDQPFDYSNQYYYVQELEVMTTISSCRMDIAICNPDLYSYLLALNACLPLDTGLPQDLYDSLKSEDRIDHNIANLQIDNNGEIHEEDGIEGDFGIRLNNTAFANSYNQPKDPSEEELPLYAVIISNTEHIDDCVTLIRAILAK